MKAVSLTGLEFSKEPDPSKMREAREFLENNRICYEQKTEHHLRITGGNGRRVNYYPTTGAVNLDNQPKFTGRGLEFLQEVLKKLGILS